MKSLILSHYRCFSQLELSFASHLNLIIGDNGSGKTSLIKAISCVMSSFFTGFSDENTRFSGLQKEDFMYMESASGLVSGVSIYLEFVFLDRSASLELRSKKGRTLQEPLKSIKELGKSYYNTLFEQTQQVKALPLIASFSTADIHASRKLNKKQFQQYKHKPSFAYYECLQGDGLLDYWSIRLLTLKEASTGEMEIQGVVNSLLKALGSEGCNLLSRVEIRPIQNKIYYFLTDGRVSYTKSLPDGLRRLINIVVDLSFRCMLLNQGIFAERACLETTGTVLIDEIDLHLHPSLQSVVVKSLQNAFPKLQFIITSHAPMVMTGIPSDSQNKIIKLNYSATDGYTATPIEAYGLDASSIIEGILGVTPRSVAVEKELIELFRLIDNDEYAIAARQLTAMQSRFGERLPELAKAQSMLNFLFLDDDRNQ